MVSRRLDREGTHCSQRLVGGICAGCGSREAPAHGLPGQRGLAAGSQPLTGPVNRLVSPHTCQAEAKQVFCEGPGRCGGGERHFMYHSGLQRLGLWEPWEQQAGVLATPGGPQQQRLC